MTPMTPPITPLMALRERCEREPASGEAHFALALALADRGEYAASLVAARRAAEQVPDDARAHRAMGHLLAREPGAEADVTASFERALALAPDDPETFEALAWHYTAVMARHVDARRVAARAITAFPHRLKSYIHLCRACLATAGRRAPWPVVATWLPRGGRIDLLRFGLGRALMDAGRYQEARGWLEDHVRLSADGPDARIAALLGRAALTLGDRVAARQHYELALRLAPDDAGLLGQYLTLLWRTGDHGTARDLLRTAAARRTLGIEVPAPLWEARAIEGRCVLLGHDDCGFGDALLWARAAPLLQAMGARVAMECQAPLRRLFETCPAIDIVVVPHDTYPAVDIRWPAAFALRTLDWDWPDIERQVPFLRVPDAARRAWRARRPMPGAGLHVGIEWRSETDKVTMGDASTGKSLPLAALRPLMELPGVACHSLHVGPAGRRELQELQELREPQAPRETRDAPGTPGTPGTPDTHVAHTAPDARNRGTSTSPSDMHASHASHASHVSSESPFVISDYSAVIGDFIDTAAAIDAMDCVVTVDTAVAHVAGALGKQTFLLLPYHAAWLWGDAATPARWYPSCRVLRQETPGDWTPLIVQVADALRVRAQMREASDDHAHRSA